MNDAVKYFQQDVRRDPSEVRTEWILTQLLRRSYAADQLTALSESSGLNYKRATYQRDLTGLVKRRLVDQPGKVGGQYSISQDGRNWLFARGVV